MLSKVDILSYIGILAIAIAAFSLAKMERYLIKINKRPAWSIFRRDRVSKAYYNNTIIRDGKVGIWYKLAIGSMFLFIISILASIWVSI